MAHDAYVWAGSFLDLISDVAPSTSDRTFDGPVVPEGQIWEVTHFAGSDIGTANKRIALQVRRGVALDTLLDKTVAASDRTLELNGRIFLYPGARLAVTVYSPAASDALQYAASGRIWKRLPAPGGP